MRLRYGTFDFQDAECLITYNGGRRKYGPRGRAERMERVWHIEGEIVASGTSSIEARRRTIEHNLSIEGSSAALLDNDGNATYELGSDFGVRIVELAWLQEE